MPRPGQGGYWYANAIRDSDLPPTSRHVAHVLASLADNGTGRVEVSLSTLARFTGLDRSTVARHLRKLEGAGFLRRRPPEKWKAIKEGAMTAYTTIIPAGFPTRGSRPVQLPLVAESPSGSRTAPHIPIGTNAGGSSADAPAPAATTTAPNLPANYGGICDCDTRQTDPDGECTRCGGIAA